MSVRKENDVNMVNGCSEESGDIGTDLTIFMASSLFMV